MNKHIFLLCLSKNTIYKYKKNGQLIYERKKTNTMNGFTSRIYASKRIESKC